jgi:hypothetical protein
MDSNMSAKRLAAAGTSSDFDPDDYPFLVSAAQVDRFELGGPVANAEDDGADAEDDPSDDDHEPPAASRRACSNFVNTSARHTQTRSASSPFEQNGVIAILCRHEVFLVFCDLIRSGEKCVKSNGWQLKRDRRKYALALVKWVINAFHGAFGIGYDIGCAMAATLARPEFAELRAELETLGCRFALPVLHAYGHGRACQLAFDPAELPEFGFENLEQSERFWAEVFNKLAGRTRYMSMDRRQLSIETTSHAHNLWKFGEIGASALGARPDTPAAELLKKKLARVPAALETGPSF